MSPDAEFLPNLLDEIQAEVKTTLDTVPKVVEAESSFTQDNIPKSTSGTWVNIPDVVAVVFDLKGSTKLDIGRNYSSAARIYKSSVESAVRVCHEFEADFIDIQGDGGFALFWSGNRYERAFCAAITIRTMSAQLWEQLSSKWSNLSVTGFKVGIHADRTIVKNLGTKRNPNEQEPVWAGKPVNYASKCANIAGRHHVVMTLPVWERLHSNDFIAFSCNCSAPPQRLWEDTVVTPLPDGKNLAVVSGTPWCSECGPDFCKAILEGEKAREGIPDYIRTSLQTMKMGIALTHKRRRDLELRLDGLNFR